ncbi:MAG: Na(+)/H(+) antiporter subunit B [Fervidobacterium sp.]|uniref:Na(+)/H(+) antiporter subunit B n=1 Tax=Fervidobacterium sp. TaxID=1871331 RepID=UPI00404AFCB0
MSKITEFLTNLELIDYLSYLVGALMVVFGIFAVEAKRIFDSLLALSALSMLSVLIFVALKAPDVAITEAAVGSGLASAVMIFALFRISNPENKRCNKNKAGEEE